MGEDQTITQEKPILKEFAPESKKSVLKEVIAPALIILAIILAGGVSGYWLNNRKGLSSGPGQVKKLMGGAELIEGPKEVGIKDASTFKDTSEGRLEMNNDTNISEGSHKLIRPGGTSKTAYLTSSAVDLNRFVGKCVQIWGETFAAQKAGWLMDVGRVKLLDKCPEGI